MKRLVVIAPNWLGDAVMALPAIADVRRAQPAASIAVAARPSVAPLFTLVREVDEVITLPKDTPPFAGYEAALLLPNSFQSALMVARAGVPERWGYRTDWRALLLTRAVPRAPSGMHQVAYYQRLVGALDFPNGPGPPRIDVTPELRDAGAGVLRQAGWDGHMPLVALAPGAAFGTAKRWPLQAFADLAAGLAEEGIGIVLVGAAADMDTAAGVLRALSGRAPCFNVAGRTDVPTLSGVLVNCRALVANDSGALHLAAALGVNVTAVFGPTDERLTAPVGGDRATSPRATSKEDDRVTSPEPRATSKEDDRAPSPEPRATSKDDDRAPGPEPRATVLIHPVWCRPCMLRECPLDHACMQGIAVPRVLDATRRML